MLLTQDVINRFAKSSIPSRKERAESYAYGMVVAENGKTYVVLDGSNIKTPVSATVTVQNNDRVLVMFKNHSAIITSSITLSQENSTELIADLTERMEGEGDG